MDGLSAEAAATATEIWGHSRHQGDKNVPICVFGVVAKAIWPKKTAERLASIAKSDVRTAKRWLKGEYPAPAILITAINHEITKR